MPRQLIKDATYTTDVSAQLASTVEERLESPTVGETVTLIVGVTGETSIAVEQISTVGGEVEEELPYESLAVSIDESDLESLCNLDVVESVEIEKEYGTRGGTDFRSR